MIYLDNAATTFPKPEEVYAAMDHTNRNRAVNAGRGSYRLAREASVLIKETKDLIRKLVNGDNGTRVIFSPSATIAMNQVVQGIALPDNSTVYVSPYEHNAVARTIHVLEKKKNIKLKLLSLKEDTLQIDLEKMKYEFSKDKPSAVFCTHVSNVTGYILPVQDIFEEARKYECINVLDSAQSLGLLEVDAKKMAVDIIVFAGHKTLYGPLGIGGFINVKNVPLDEVIVGGTGSDSLNLNMPADSEGKYEAASSNVIAIAGLNAAINCLNQKQMYEIEHQLTTYLVNRLKEIPEITLYVPEMSKEHIGVVSFSLDGYNSEDVGFILDEDYDIAVRTGYHCAPFIHKYLKDIDKLGTVRVSIGQYTTKSDIDELVDALESMCN